MLDRQGVEEEGRKKRKDLEDLQSSGVHPCSFVYPTPFYNLAKATCLPTKLCLAKTEALSPSSDMC